MQFNTEEILSLEWFHSIRLSENFVTPGRKSLNILEMELQKLKLPDLRGKSVLDVGAYDGFFSFAAERLGAKRVVALDHYVWSTDMASYTKDWRESKRTGGDLPPPHKSAHWYPDSLPGKKPFDLARNIMSSKVEPFVGDFMSMDLTQLGKFDVVLFLGVLYHLENPFEAIKKLFTLVSPNGLVVIETEAMEIPGFSKTALCEFFPGKELNNDPSNWWAPNAKALESMCKAVGFRKVTLFAEQSFLGKSKGIYKSFRSFIGSCFRDFRGGRFRIPVRRYRAFVHAWA